MPDPRFKPAAPFSQSDIHEIESVLRRKLPEDYCRFVQEYGGAFVGGLVDGSEEFSLMAFFAADDLNGVLAILRLHPDLRDEGVLPFADCELGNLYVMDRDNAVHYIDYYGGSTKSQKIAETFQELVMRIVVPDE
jgi:hypothetical protein